jgi:hypothetical protein
VQLKSNEKGGKEINREIKSIVAGGGKPRPDPLTGQQAIYRGDENPDWAGALEYEVTVPGRKNEVRILKLQTGTNLTTGEPKFRFGWSTTHYKKIYDFKPLNSTPQQ